MMLKSLLVLAASLLWFVPSLNGQTWRWSNPLPNGNNITGLAQNGMVSAEVAELGQIYIGNNFYDWAPCIVPTTNDLQAVTFFGNRLVAVGENGTVVYSDDYVNFTNVALNTTPNWLIAVAASPNLLVTVGDNAILYTSTNGANWTVASAAAQRGVGLAGQRCLWQWHVRHRWRWWLYGQQHGRHSLTNHFISTPNSIFWLAYVSGSGSATNFPYAGFWAVTDGE